MSKDEKGKLPPTKEEIELMRLECSPEWNSYRLEDAEKEVNAMVKKSEAIIGEIADVFSRANSEITETTNFVSQSHIVKGGIAKGNEI